MLIVGRSSFVVVPSSTNDQPRTTNRVVAGEGFYYDARLSGGHMRKKRIGLLFGMEDTFPWALINAINARGGDRVLAVPVELSYVKDDGVFEYDLILDRISHEIPFYRTYLKCAAASGVRIVNNPIWWSADDKF